MISLTGEAITRVADRRLERSRQRDRSVIRQQLASSRRPRRGR